MPFDSLVTVVIVFLCLIVLTLLIILLAYRSQVKKSTEELYQMNVTLKKVNLEKDRFLSQISHDMRTPLNGILSLAEISLDHPADEVELLENMGMIHISAQFLLTLINDLLNMSRLINGKTLIAPVPTNATTFFNSLIPPIQGTANQNQITLVSDIDLPPDTTLMIDPLHTAQIINNFLSNALKFTPEKGQITLLVKPLKEADGKLTLKISVQDTGIGMSPSFLDHVFEPFAQEEQNSLTLKGSGLGMAIAKHLTEVMGGKILVESTKGKGSLFSVIFAFDITEPIKEEPSPKPRHYDFSEWPKMRILVMEDQPINQIVIRKLLTPTGFDIEIEDNGALGLQRYLETPAGYFNLILTDIQMPKLNGIDAAKAIRASSKSDAQSIPIIALSANVYQNDFKKSLAAGMNDHLSKPIDKNALYEMLNRYLKDIKKSD